MQIAHIDKFHNPGRGCIKEKIHQCRSKSRHNAVEEKPGGMVAMNFRQFANEFWAAFALAGVLMSAVAYRLFM